MAQFTFSQTLNVRQMALHLKYFTEQRPVAAKQPPNHNPSTTILDS